jgi:hypothetical protein
MPSCPDSTSPPLPPPEPWTAAEAQAALAEVAYQLVALVDTLEAVHTGLPEPPDIDDRYEHRKPLNVAADVLSTIECVLEDNLRPAIESLQRSAGGTDEELAREYRERQKREERL